MYKLLIVDDEHYITDGLYRTFSSLSNFHWRYTEHIVPNRHWIISHATEWILLSQISICPL